MASRCLPWIEVQTNAACVIGHALLDVGSLAVLGIADHRYSAKALTRVEKSFFFQTENASAADRQLDFIADGDHCVACCEFGAAHRIDNDAVLAPGRFGAFKSASERWAADTAALKRFYALWIVVSHIADSRVYFPSFHRVSSIWAQEVNMKKRGIARFQPAGISSRLRIRAFYCGAVPSVHSGLS